MSDIIGARVLGIDASLSCTGWGIVEIKDAGAQAFIDAGELKFKLNDDDDGPHSREYAIAYALAELIPRYGIHFAYTEEVGRARNIKVFRKLVGLRGIIGALIYVQSARRIHVTPMTSAEWRSRVGMPGDTKDELWHAFQDEFQIEACWGEDATEGALIALAGARELLAGEHIPFTP